jgi:hypothetical protein
MSDPILPNLAEIQALEVELQRGAARKSYARLNALLQADFLEFGSSGRRYTKSEILNMLPLEESPADVWSENFELQMLGPGVALLTYLSAHASPDGTRERNTLRSSIWQWTEHGWQIRFHQGTPT